MHFSLLCDFALCTGVLVRPLGEISLLCSANLHTLASQTSTPFNLYSSNVEPPSVYWRGGGAGGTNLLFFRDGKLDVCAPVSVFTATAGKYAAHFMDTWRCEIGRGRALASTGELLKLLQKRLGINYGISAGEVPCWKIDISTLFGIRWLPPKKSWLWR